MASGVRVFLARIHQKSLLQLLCRRAARPHFRITIDARQQFSRGRREAAYLPWLTRGADSCNGRLEPRMNERHFSGNELHGEDIVERLELAKNLVGFRV